MSAAPPWDGNLPRLAPVWPLLALCTLAAFLANALLATIAVSLGRRGAHTLHIALLAGVGAASSLSTFVPTSINAAAGRLVGGQPACSAQAGVCAFFGIAYSVCLVHQSVRAFRLVVLGRHTTPRHTVAFHVVGFAAAAALTVLIAGAPGRSILVNSRTYCMPAVDDPVSSAASGVIVLATGVPLVWSYVQLWRHARAVAAAARPLRSVKPALVVPQVGSRVGIRSFTLVALYCVAYAPYPAITIVGTANHGASPEALDLVCAFALPLCLIISAALQLRWHAAFRREAAGWATAAWTTAAGARAAANRCATVAPLPGSARAPRDAKCAVRPCGFASAAASASSPARTAMSLGLLSPPEVTTTTATTTVRPLIGSLPSP